MKQDLEKKLSVLSHQFVAIVNKLGLEKKREEVRRLEAESTKPDLWQNQGKAGRLMKRLGDLRTEVEAVEKLKEKINSLGEMLKITEEKSADDLTYLQHELDQFERNLAKFEVKSFLSGPYDRSDTILSIHAGQGGTEACDWAAMLQRMYYRFCEKQNWQVEVVDERPGEEAGVKKVTLFIRGNYSYGYLKGEKGTHRLVRLSPFNANNLRQTSFALVEVMPIFEEENEAVKIKPADLEIDFSRATGHGGQNVNKVSTAVRIKHRSSGIVVECQTQRYQDQNRKIALQILKGKLWQLQEEEKNQKIQNLKGEHKIAGWGNQIRSYVLHPYKLVKDIRTGHETSNAFEVLDGDLNDFIKSYLMVFGRSDN